MTSDDENGLKELGEVYQLLREEFDFMAKAQVEPDSSILYPDPAFLDQIERRAMIRSAFALIEAAVFAMKTVAVRWPGPVALSPGEIALAREEDYELSDKGVVLERPARLPFLKNLRFAFYLFEKTAGAEHQLDVSGDGWQSLQRAIKVRDRLMHPKWPRDLAVTDEEVQNTLRAVIWLQKETESTILRGVSAVKSYTQRLQSETERLRCETKIVQQETRRLRLETKKIRRARSGRGSPSV